ncbi:T9SS-dependent M36 family metallopeptidase [uncultured Flavobacterium sp.]|uniref:T9SS-dependent M36 family metallopeptidase n=1 Tax=uncultured Flavobacterium sp. TaxID=165435 RepID=UPI0030ED1E30
MKKTLLFLFLFTISIGFSQEPTAKIQNYLNNNKAKFGLSTQDISDWVVESKANSQSTKIDNYYIKQQHQGIEVYQSNSNVWIKNGEVINMHNAFVPNLAQKINAISPSVSLLDALSNARQLLNDSSVNSQIIETVSTRKFKLSNGNQTDSPVLAALVYHVLENKNVRLAWDLNFYSQDTKHLWSVRIDAITNQLIEKHDWVISCSFGDTNHKNHNHTNEFFFNKVGFNEFSNTMLNPQSGSYRVIPYNYESPSHIARQLISNPEDALASPYGWHDVNGVTGAEFTITNGNNVFAYDDVDTNNTGGTSPDGSASLMFDFPYVGTGAVASTYLPAATTNLYYMNNMMHDVWYKYGFNEANGNFQRNNYGRGGLSTFLGDAVNAEAQDGGGVTPNLNNANFATPIDGSKPRMQMYLWDVPPTLYPLTINSPADIAGPREGRDNVFNPGHVDLPVAPAMIQADLVLFDDGTPDVGQTDNADGCSAAVNAAAVNGKIAVIRRSTAATLGGTPCTFVEKVLNAQAAGAIAVVIVNNVDPSATVPAGINMSGADATITIPAISVTKAVGYALIAKIKVETVNAKIQITTPVSSFVNSDGDFDNGIIAHEYGHGISNRLTGGASNSSCLQNAEQMGEGWSDWFALMMQLKTGDIGSTPKGIGTFAVGQNPQGGGIRNFPYSTDMTINPLTFNNSNDTESHNRGEFMTAVLWDLSWAYIDKYGFDSNIYNGTGGNNKVMQLVIDGLKLQPCSPSTVQFRDAIIAADQATTGGQDFCLIWQVFARRGVGVGASSGSNSSAIDQVENFTEPTPGPNCVLKASLFNNEDMIRVFPNPSNGLLNIAIAKYNGKLNIELYDINGRKVFNQNMNDFNTEKSINLQSIQSGIYLLKLEGDELSFTKKIIIN